MLCINACMHPYMHPSIHEYIPTYITFHYIALHCITLHCIALHTDIHTYMIIHVYSRVYIYYCFTVFTYIYIHMCVFSCSLSAPPGLFAKKQRISYSPQKGWNVTHFAMFDWRRVPHSTDSSSCSPMKKNIYNLPNLLSSPENHHTPSAVFHTFP